MFTQITSQPRSKNRSTCSFCTLWLLRPSATDTLIFTPRRCSCSWNICSRFWVMVEINVSVWSYTATPTRTVGVAAVWPQPGSTATSAAISAAARHRIRFMWHTSFTGSPGTATSGWPGRTCSLSGQWKTPWAPPPSGAPCGTPPRRPPPPDIRRQTHSGRRWR